MIQKFRVTVSLFASAILVLAIASCATPSAPGAGATPQSTLTPTAVSQPINVPTSGSAPTIVLPTASPAVAPATPAQPTSTSVSGYPIPPTPTPFTRQATPSVPLGEPPSTPTPILLKPQSARAEQGKAYSFSLYTHCGVDFSTDFDGSFWDAASPRPAQIGNPFQQGTMTLIDENHARFTYDKGVIDFTRHIGSKFVPFLCM